MQFKYEDYDNLTRDLEYFLLVAIINRIEPSTHRKMNKVEKKLRQDIDSLRKQLENAENSLKT